SLCWCCWVFVSCRSKVLPCTTLFRSTRAGLTALLLSVAVVLAWVGPPLVDLLYDARYVSAGGVLVAIVCIQMLQVIPISYEYSRSEEHTSELQSRENLVCRLLLEKKK